MGFLAERRIAVACAIGLILLWLAAFLTGCTGIAWDSTLGVSMSVYGREDAMTPGQVDTMALHLVSGLNELGWDPGHALACVSDVYLFVHPGPFPCWTKSADGDPGTGLCNGQQQAINVRVAQTPCPYTGAFEHELTHWLQECVHGVYDANHSDKAVWAISAVAAGTCEE